MQFKINLRNSTSVV